MAATECRHTEESGVEPHDPDVDSPIYQRRRSTRLAPSNVKTSRLPKPLLECGCGDCPEHVDPLADSGDTTLAADACHNPQPMTVERGTDVLLRYQRAAWNSDSRTSKYERSLGKYQSLLEADRQMRRQYDGRLTTVMLTRRLSPIERGQWVTPYELDQRLHSPDRSVNDALRYRLRDYAYEYLGVAATTDSAATPHEHIYLWIDDSDDEINPSLFTSLIEKHVTVVTGASGEKHRVGEAITVEHNPPLVDHVPNRISRILDDSTTTADGSVPVNTAGAQYLASQLPFLPIGDVYCADVEVDEAVIDGATVAWVGAHDTIRSSSGISL